MADDISKRIKEAIEKSGYTLVKLQEITGIPKSAIQRYATGDTDKLPIDRVKKIAIATNVSPAYLMGWDDSEKMLEGVEKEIGVSAYIDILNGDFCFYTLDLKKIVYSGIFDSYKKYNSEYYKWHYDTINKLQLYVATIDKAIEFTLKNNFPMLAINKKSFELDSHDFKYNIDNQKEWVESLDRYLDDLSIMDDKNIIELYNQLATPISKREILENEYPSYNWKNISDKEINEYYERYLEVVKLEKNKFEICIGIKNKQSVKNLTLSNKVPYGYNVDLKCFTDVDGARMYMKENNFLYPTMGEKPHELTDDDICALATEYYKICKS